jgi:hypothetical protein
MRSISNGVTMRAHSVLGFALLVVVAGLVGASEGEGPRARLLAARLNANETAAIATLRNLGSAQAHFQACCSADEDGDGTGEFGCFAELSAALPVRGTKHRIEPAVMSPAFQGVTKKGTIHRTGYVFAIYLPGKKGAPIAESPGGGVAPGVLDADLAEAHWLAYAWPEKHGETGRRTFVINQQGDVFATKHAYSGEKGPAPTAALARSKAKGTPITGGIVDGKPASDGLTWTVKPSGKPVPVAPEHRSSVSACTRMATLTCNVLVEVQDTFRLDCHVDEDSDRKGEFCTLGEMAGAHCFRGTTKQYEHELLPGILAADGTYRFEGYRFAVWLPGPGGLGIRETKHGLAGGRTDPDLAEKHFVLYAWPEEYGKTGIRTFVTTPDGSILQVITDRYSGERMPEPGAAFQPVTAKPAATMLGRICTDRSVWTQVD